MGGSILSLSLQNEKDQHFLLLGSKWIGINTFGVQSEQAKHSYSSHNELA